MNPHQTTITVQISPGELLDRICILRIKSERIQNPQKLNSVRIERSLFEDARRRFLPVSAAIEPLEAALTTVNERLWQSENLVRACERAQDFGPRFIAAARSICRLNDERALLKREINQILNSPLIEEKVYIDPHDIGAAEEQWVCPESQGS